MSKSKYKINVRVLQGRVLNFFVDDYSIVKGDFVEFYDKVTNKLKKFHSSNCEIDEVDND